MIRPSARVAEMASSLTRTSVILTSRFTAVFMPSSPFHVAIFRQLPHQRLSQKPETPSASMAMEPKAPVNSELDVFHVS
jgi:hypothetical protein